MIKGLSGAIAVALLLVPSLSRAETSDDVHGFQLGFRTGLQLASGKYGNDIPMSDGVSSGLPLWFDVGHRVSRNFYYGLSLAYAPSLGTPNCEPCSASNLRTGLNLEVHPTVSMEQLDPYFGFGVMYDVLNVGLGDQSISTKGMEFANLQLGADYLVMPELSAGAFFSYSFGMYFGTDHGDIHDVGLHDWITFGIRSSYRL